MSRLVLAVLALVLAVPSASAEKSCPSKSKDDSFEAASCQPVRTPSSFCAQKEDFDRPQDIGLAELRECANEMQNCACGLIGSSNCTSIDSVGRVVLGQTPAHPDPKALSLQLDPATGDVMVMLDKATARKVSDAASYTNDNELGKMRIEEHVELYRLTTAVALFDSAKRFGNNLGTVTVDAISGSPIVEYQDRMLNLFHRELAMEAMWEQIMEGLRACRAMSSRPSPDQPDAANWYYRNNLVCALREGSELARHHVLMQWPGCECHRGFGRVLPGSEVCIMNDNSADKFAQEPIDERMPEMLSAFVRSLESRTGLKVKKLGTFGCGFERFETGPNVKNLADMPAPRRALHASHISDHARGTACDLTYVTFKIGECDEWTMKLTTDSDDPATAPKKTQRPFYDSLLVYLNNKGHDPRQYLFGEKRITRNGTGTFYRDLEKELTARPTKTPGEKGYSARDEHAWQLRVGASVRNALVDSGFIVYDPTTNLSHLDHFHFEIPANDSELELLSAPETTGDALKTREAVIDRYLWRAAGMTSSGQGK